MKTVTEILRGKNTSELCTTTPAATVISAIGLMAEKNVGSLLVMENDKLVGIITERDYARKVILAGKSSSNTLVKEIMTKKVLVIQPSTTIEECMALMIENNVRYLPVIEEGKVIGVISIGNVIKTIISEQKFTIKNLEQYIMQG